MTAAVQPGLFGAPGDGEDQMTQDDLLVGIDRSARYAASVAQGGVSGLGRRRPRPRCAAGWPTRGHRRGRA